MPVARDFFPTFYELAISENPWVLYEGLIGWLEEIKGEGSALDHLMSGVDIEALHSEIESDRDAQLAKGSMIDAYYSFRAYNELVFLFASVLNEIQNGPVSAAHTRLADALSPGDAVVTFNWDTLLDRALAEVTGWRPDWGYGVRPNQVFHNGWREAAGEPVIGAPRLVKLHGSTNWLTAYPAPDETGKIRLTHELDPSAFNVFVQADEPYDCYAGRYMSGYGPYSYGYYPPNLGFPGRPAPAGHAFASVRMKAPWKPEGQAGSRGLVSMPLIIPPVKHKTYDMFGGLFGRLWQDAEDLLAEADEIVVIGYSFPVTDIQSDQLFRRAFMRRRTMPAVTIIDPVPDRAASVFRDQLGIREPALTVRAEYFTQDTAI
tara:strand:+ start:549 stop:1673 length:1125 start_codon:yes stop_codon:yes gene_type:complete